MDFCGKSRILLLALPLVALACGGGGPAGHSGVPGAAATPAGPRPNIVVVIADDLDTRAFPAMPKIMQLLAAEGTSFDNSFVSSPVCAPDRTSLFTGQHTHNHQIFTIKYPTGGFPKYMETGIDRDTVGVWLRAAGYRTALVGKILNQYSTYHDAYNPAGWDETYIPRQANQYFDLQFDANGRIEAAPEVYEADSLAWYSRRFMRSAAASGTPFFLYVAPVAPHKPYQPAPRHAGLFSRQVFDPAASYNEDIADKPDWLRKRQYIPLTAADLHYLEKVNQRRRETDLALDELVETIVGELASLGALGNTYVVFTSDNGYEMGEHRILEGKDTPYEESIKVPLVVRGPEVRVQRLSDLVSVVDLTATIADWARVTPPRELDGRSFAPLLRGERVPWRGDVLVEHYDPLEEFGEAPTFFQLRTPRWSYVEYIDGERELYDLQKDPYELDDIFGVPTMTIPPEAAQLAQRLNQLKTCRGASCFQ